MTVSFKFNLGDMVTIKDAKIDGRITGAMVNVNDGRQYRVEFWHEGSKRIEVLDEWELE